MPKSLTQIVTDNGGDMLFTSSQDTITTFLSGPAIVSYEGVCAALVIMWFVQDTSKTDPCKGIKNKTKALALQGKMESTWEGLGSVKKEAEAQLTNCKFWYQSTSKNTYTSEKLGAEHFLQHDPQSGRESRCILVIYFPSGPAHAIGVWRFPTGAMVLYDPNNGAGVLSAKGFRGFLNEFLKEQYSTTNGYAIAAFYTA